MTSQNFFWLKKPILAKKNKKNGHVTKGKTLIKKLRKKSKKKKNSKKVSDQKKVTRTKSYKVKKVLLPESSEARKVPG